MSIVSTLITFASFLLVVNGHGYLALPMSRNALQVVGNGLCSWNGLIPCGGDAQSWNIVEPSTGCGIIQQGGAPYVFGDGGLGFKNTQFKTMYTMGELVQMSVQMTAYHGGIFEFKIQDVGTANDPNGALWDSLNLLTVESFSPLCVGCATEPCVALKTCAQIPLTGNSPSGIHTVMVRLPSNLVCNHCVLQWRYVTANSCPGGVSCSTGEKFWNCADLQIISSVTQPTSTPITRNPSSNAVTTTSLPSPAPYLMSSTPSAIPAVTSSYSLVGYYNWNWGGGSVGSKVNVATMVAAFSGYTDLTTALSSSTVAPGYKPGMDKYITVGGGNAAGTFTATSLDKLIADISSGKVGNAGYTGIVFDIEEGDSGLVNKFQSAFLASKTMGLKVLVTTSHSAPYGFADGATLVTSWVSDSNIDYLSPQLYSSGDVFEPGPNYQAAWSLWRNSKARLVPSIPFESDLPAMQSWATTNGLTVVGYVLWGQTTAAPAPTPVPAPSTTSVPVLQPVASPASTCGANTFYCDVSPDVHQPQVQGCSCCCFWNMFPTSGCACGSNIPPSAAPTQPTVSPTSPTAGPTKPTTSPSTPSATPVKPTGSPTMPTSTPAVPTPRPSFLPTVLPVSSSVAPAASPVSSTTTQPVSTFVCGVNAFYCSSSPYVHQPKVPGCTCCCNWGMMPSSTCGCAAATAIPTRKPTAKPSSNPTGNPSRKPSSIPTQIPRKPTAKPSSKPK